MTNRDRFFICLLFATMIVFVGYQSFYISEKIDQHHADILDHHALQIDLLAACIMDESQCYVVIER